MRLVRAGEIARRGLLCWVTVLGSCLTAAPVLAVERPALAETVVVGTFNVRNYLENNRWHAGQFRFEHPKPEAEKRAVREAIKAADPDVLFLQEMGSPAHLEELRRDLEAEGCRYPFSHFAASADARSGLGMLSRLAPAHAVLLEPRDSTGQVRMRRGIHEVVIPFGTTRLRALHVHLKSRYTDDAGDPDSRAAREREINALVEAARHCRSLYPEDEALLVGDFNTPFEDPLMQPLWAAFAPVEVADRTGAAWTYHHFKSDLREKIDGFWKSRGGRAGVRFESDSLWPEKAAESGSDHRLVTIRIVRE